MVYFKILHKFVFVLASKSVQEGFVQQRAMSTQSLAALKSYSLTIRSGWTTLRICLFLSVSPHAFENF